MMFLGHFMVGIIIAIEAALALFKFALSATFVFDVGFLRVCGWIFFKEKIFEIILNS
jgi:hypothetical protein